MRSPAPLQRLSPAQGLACRAGLLTVPQLHVSMGLPLILRGTNLASLASTVVSPQLAQNRQGFHRTGGCFKSTALPVSDKEEPPPSSQALLLQGNPTWPHLSRGTQFHRPAQLRGPTLAMTLDSPDPCRPHGGCLGGRSPLLPQQLPTACSATSWGQALQGSCSQDPHTVLSFCPWSAQEG